jgi:acyl-coenzyme A thioesterase 13
MADAGAAPEGFTLSPPRSRFLDLLGDLYQTDPKQPNYRIGLWLAERHCNFYQTAHGGVLSTLLDVHLGRLLAFSSDPPLGFITLSLTTDYLGQAKLGQWIECRGRIDRIGRTISHSSGLALADGKPVARGSAIFQMRSDPTGLAENRV